MTKKVNVTEEENLAPETSVYVELKDQNPDSDLNDPSKESSSKEDSQEELPKLGGFLVMDVPES